MHYFGLMIHTLLYDYFVYYWTNDVTIIQKTFSLKVFNKQEMQAINKVRLALQVMFLSELVED